jgi:hypothetical protein
VEAPLVKHGDLPSVKFGGAEWQPFQITRQLSSLIEYQGRRYTVAGKARLTVAAARRSPRTEVMACADTRQADRLEAGLPHYSAVPFKLLEDPGISSGLTIAVYAAIRRFADFRTGDRCFPSISRIAKLARCGERSG